MDNKNFHELIVKIVNEINNDKRTGEVQHIIKETLEKYNLSLENYKTYNDTINYRGVFLNIYYTISRIEEIKYEINSDYNGDTQYITALSYIKSALGKAGIYSEYAAGTVTEEKFERIKTEFGI